MVHTHVSSSSLLCTIELLPAHSAAPISSCLRLQLNPLPVLKLHKETPKAQMHLLHIKKKTPVHVEMIIYCDIMCKLQKNQYMNRCVSVLSDPAGDIFSL